MFECVCVCERERKCGMKEGKEKLRMLCVCSIYTSITNLRSVSSSVFVYAYKGEK